MTKNTTTTKRAHDRRPDAEPATPYLDLASEAVLAGMTREQVIAQIVSRIKRDQGYLAYRKACNRRTTYDDQVLADIQALALAVVLLDPDGASNVGAYLARAPADLPSTSAARTSAKGAAKR